MSALAEEIKAAVREALREELPSILAGLRPVHDAPELPARLDVCEAAALAHRHPDTIRRAISSGKLRASKPDGGRQWVLERQDVEQWFRGDSPAKLDMHAEVEKAVARVRG